jgi:hypothetical protein
MRKCSLYIKDAATYDAKKEFGEWYNPLYEANRSYIAEHGPYSVFTFLFDEDVAALKLKFGDRIEIEDPPEGWQQYPEKI